MFGFEAAGCAPAWEVPAAIAAAAPAIRTSRRLSEGGDGIHYRLMLSRPESLRGICKLLAGQQIDQFAHQPRLGMAERAFA